MKSLPPIVWVAAVGALLVLLGLCGATAYGVLRASARSRIVRWPAARILVLLAASAVPWLVVRLKSIGVEVKIHGILELIGWVLAALVVFALLVLLPLAAVLCGIVWWTGRRARANP